MTAPPPRILFLDANDSFTNNITSLLTLVLGVRVHVLTFDPNRHDHPLDIDAQTQFLREELKYYDAVVCGPGPGHPECEVDVGFMRAVWAQATSPAPTTADGTSPRQQPAAAHPVAPAFGVCLGFQSLVSEFLTEAEGKVQRLEKGLHGRVWRIEVVKQDDGERDQDIFQDVGEDGFHATLYHSLGYVFRNNGGPKLKELVPLAWAAGEVRNDALTSGGASIVEHRILMAVRHQTKPFWGVQFHPESICTDKTAAANMLRRWWQCVCDWNAKSGRVVDRSGVPRAKPAQRMSLMAMVDAKMITEPQGFAWMGGSSDTVYSSKIVKLPVEASRNMPALVELLRLHDDHNVILLESSNAWDRDMMKDVRGRYSILALDVNVAPYITYRAGARHATVSHTCSWPRHRHRSVSLAPFGGSVWALIAYYQHVQRRRLQLFTEAAEQSQKWPFVAGFAGYATYELGLHGINVTPACGGWDGDQRGHKRPDLHLVWVTRSVVVDHVTNEALVQSVAECTNQRESQAWVEELAYTIERNGSGKGLQFVAENSAKISRCDGLEVTSIVEDMPDMDAYERKVLACQEYIAAGDSYELCLTDQTRITVSYRRLPGVVGSDTNRTAPPFSWSFYKDLRTSQPAPYAAYVRLGGTTLVSASPERFLRFGPASEKDDGKDGRRLHSRIVCTMHPMKGTVRKDVAPTVDDARKLLHIPKEIAENLMIVDLVRHDLFGVSGAELGVDHESGSGTNKTHLAEDKLPPSEKSAVTVPTLLGIEGYKNVWQMVSVVRAVLPPPPESLPAADNEPVQREHTYDTYYSGLDVLAASLPPGSMTGAPKLRSCCILEKLERGGPNNDKAASPGPSTAPEGVLHARTPERSLYSGVVGYADILGRGDWSVSIRCLFNHCTGHEDLASDDSNHVDTDGTGSNDDDDTRADRKATGDAGEISDCFCHSCCRHSHGDTASLEQQHVAEQWIGGAGGAVTILSTAQGESAEMLTKLAGSLRVVRSFKLG